MYQFYGYYTYLNDTLPGLEALILIEDTIDVDKAEQLASDYLIKKGTMNTIDVRSLFLKKVSSK